MKTQRGQFTSGGPLVSILLLILIVWIALNFSGSLTSLIINSIIGLAILVLLNLIPGVNIKISIWSVLIVAFGGILGILILLLLNFAGYAI